MKTLSKGRIKEIDLKIKGDLICEYGNGFLNNETTS